MIINGKDFEGGGHSLLVGSIPTFAWTDFEKLQKHANLQQVSLHIAAYRKAKKFHQQFLPSPPPHQRKKSCNNKKSQNATNTSIFSFDK
jgi:hypothetical protein